ncbi:MazG family protein [Syntrophobacter fumaroxidans]|uniref:MazG family protein n=1 Tax=Syntrophobacter fumaroxidans (strain DSM 10017 / MPOB) TaxID=335543 RepID=A0LK91_SYNFM|nr:MazG family protein [Syntrophobacter fumaroxidans]ABK17843.1 MazG family protein [Syntrophobacter fumaroxidans MPOB]
MTTNDLTRWNKVRRIYEIIDRLRGESGCPWDRKQTPDKVQTYLIEEAHEAASAVRAGRREEAAEELGDLLFMVFFLIHLYEESGDFRLEEVCDAICEKMVRRHPHVFGETRVASAREVKENWEKIKADEKATAGKEQDRVPESLPALMRAYRMLARLSHKQGGDLNDVSAQTRKFLEMGRGLAADPAGGNTVSADDFGEMLLALVNLARLKGYRAEDCLHQRLVRLETP